MNIIIIFTDECYDEKKNEEGKFYNNALLPIWKKVG